MSETFEQYTARLLGLLGDDDPLPVLASTPERLGRLIAGHAERGRESIRHLERLNAGHDRNHLAQIERLIASRAPDAAGRAFSPVPDAVRAG